MKRWMYSAALLPFALAACDDGDDPFGPEATVPVQVAFATTTTAQASASPASLSTAQQQELVIPGDNGVLTITDIRMIVAEFEMEGPEACLPADVDDEELEECEFEAPPSLVDLPLGAGEVVVATGEVAPGTYSVLEFEIEDLDLSDEDADQEFAGAITSIRQALLGVYPSFPDEASMVVTGTFTPTDGTARDFVVFFDADIEVETDLVPPLVIDEAGVASRTLTVNLNPALWFVQDGQVLDLSQFDFAATGELLEFELEIEQGFGEVEVDDD